MLESGSSSDQGGSKDCAWLLALSTAPASMPSYSTSRARYVPRLAVTAPLKEAT